MRVSISPAFRWALAVAAGFVCCAAPATQPPDRNAWDGLRPDSEAHVVLKRRCLTDSGEEFLGTLEHVKGIYLESEARTMAFITGDSDGYGISYTNPPYMFLRNGLYYVEYSSELPGAAIFGRIAGEDGRPYVRFDTITRNKEDVTERTAQVRISFKRTTTEAEENVGVFGRLIEIYDDSSNRTLARRRDYVWLNPNRRGPHGGFMCPTIPEGESFPISFLAKTVNVQGYTCWARFAQAKRMMGKKYDLSVFDKLIKEMNQCEADYFQRTTR